MPSTEGEKEIVMRTLSRTNGVSRRLATLKLAALTAKDLANEIESEAREMFHLDSASLLFDSESSSGVKDPYITGAGVAIPFEHGLLLGNCRPHQTMTGFIKRASTLPKWRDYRNAHQPIDQQAARAQLERSTRPRANSRKSRC